MDEISIYYLYAIKIHQKKLKLVFAFKSKIRY
jgi:hypothetical protein